MGYYIKKTEQTAPVQAVTESSLKSASEINVPTVKAVLDGLHYPNLLINGDFQCNQRGQSEYISNPMKAIYTVDMWRFSMLDKLTLTINEEYITFSNLRVSLASFTQTCSELDMSKKYTLVIKLRNESPYLIKKEAGQVINYEFKKGVFARVTEGKLVGISINGGIEIDIEYIDLFEGDIAYPHAKEDYTVALMRCQRKLLVFNNTPVGIGNFYNNTVYATIFIPTSLDNVPTISFNGYRFIIDGMDVANITNVVFGSMSQNLIYVKITLAKSFNSSMNGLSGRVTAQGTGNEFLCFSCEPL